MNMIHSSKYWLASTTTLSRYGKPWADSVAHRSALLLNIKKTPQRFQSALAVPDGNKGNNIQAPKVLTTEMAMGCQDAMKLFLKHGLGMQRLKDIAKNANESNTLVQRWQRMMEAFIGTQVHVLAGMGYSPDEAGLGTLP
jgi:hypothetical protein